MREESGVSLESRTCSYTLVIFGSRIGCPFISSPLICGLSHSWKGTRSLDTTVCCSAAFVRFWSMYLCIQKGLRWFR
jgi:hypothetical protein